MVKYMTEKEKQIYQSAKADFYSWPKWKQEAALNFMNSYKEEPEVNGLKLCPKCGKIAGFNSWFQAFYCTSCGHLWSK